MNKRKVMFSTTIVLALLISLIVPASATISPTELTAVLAPGESITETKEVFVPPRPPEADVVFSFDLTGSMGGIISTAKTQAGSILADLNAIPGVDIQYGVMSYMDYPGSYTSCGYSDMYGDAGSGDYAYSLDQAVTSSSTDIINAISGLTLGWGADGPQDYTRIFYESYADPNVSWRSGAKRILVNFGDNVPHDCNLNEGVTSGTWTTGCDPGRDEISGTSDDLDLQTVLGDMATDGVVLLESHTTSYANAYWTYWTGLTSGDVFITSSSTLVDDIVEAVTDALEAPMVYDLHLEASAGFEAWLYDVEPDSYDVDPGNTGATVSFDVTIQVPDGTAPGIYNFTISAVDEVGVNYGDQNVMVVVYDPNAGFVTGGGWIDSPYGALRLPTDLPFFNGSYYELAELPFAPWGEANGAANAATLEGCEYSHLVTIASQEEQDVLYEFFDGYLQGKWYGGFQNEGETDPAAGWNWVTGETWDYTNWAPGEPNDADGPGSEPHLIGWQGGWAWNDEGSLGNVTGYVIEYENCGPTGKANFGFVSKYKKGANTPTGNTEFQFHDGDLNFHSTSYDWLVVTGSNYAKFKGTGTINGEGGYKFMLWAGDDDPDTFRIKIWSEDNGEAVVYDNGMDQEIGGGRSGGIFGGLYLSGIE